MVSLRYSWESTSTRAEWQVDRILNLLFRQPQDCGCHIGTVPHDILAKAKKLGGMDVCELSLDAVRMFYRDASAAGISL